MTLDAKTVFDFINRTNAFKFMPEQYLRLTKNNLVKGDWNIYRFEPRNKNDEGYECDQALDGDIFATYCWYGNDEYCITSQDYFEKFVSRTYQSKGVKVNLTN